MDPDKAARLGKEKKYENWLGKAENRRQSMNIISFVLVIDSAA